MSLVVRFVNFEQNGHPILGPVPDLQAAAQQAQAQQLGVHQAEMVRANVLGSAGVMAGGPARVVLADGRDLLGDGINLLVLVGSAAQIVYASMVLDDGLPVTWPWHAVIEISPRPDIEQWVAEHPERLAGGRS
jgi:hypothetical protein